ncbi:MAG: hypothetical protein ACTSXA_09585 [Candidatus Heimdallarchaeota archaeon]
MATTKKFFTKRNGILFGLMMVIAIGMMVVFIVGMMNSSMGIALGGFFGGAVLLVVIMMIFVFGGKDKNTDKLVKIEGWDRKGPTIIESKDEQIDWYKTKKLIYKGKITKGEATCPVCKLGIKDNEAMVMQCPQCLSLYHGEHFIEWLMEHRTCPVCTFEIEVRK